MAKQSTTLFRSFITEDNNFVIFSVIPNVPSTIAKVTYTYSKVSSPISNNSYDVNFKVTLLDVCQDGFKQNLENLVTLLFLNTFKVSLSNQTFTYDTSITPSDVNNASDPDFIYIALGKPKLFADLSHLLIESLGKQKSQKILPSSLSFYGSKFDEFVKETFGFEVKEISANLPDILPSISYENSEAAWQHPLIAAEPEKFRPKVDPELVDVISSSSNVFKWCMDFLQKQDPTNPNKNILLIGAAAVGKSETVRAIAHVLNLPYAEYTFTRTSEFADSVGKITATMASDAKDWAFLPTEVFAVMQAGGIVNFEEVSAMVESHQIEGNNVISGLNRYLYASGHKINIDPSTIFFGTMNVAYGGLSKIQTAFASRWKRLNYEQPSVDVVTKYYVKKYQGLADKKLITDIVKFTFDIGDVLSRSPSFSKDDPHFGPAPAVHNRNRRDFVFDLFSNPDKSVREIVENFIRQQIHTDYFSEQAIDKVLTECAIYISDFEQKLTAEDKALPEFTLGVPNKVSESIQETTEELKKEEPKVFKVEF
jgi:hypothetical protein